MSDERLLPTVGRLTGGEVLRVVGPDGKRMLMPVSSLLDAAVGRFATQAGENARVAALWDAVNSLTSRTAALEDVADEPDPVSGVLQAEIDKLHDSVAVLTARVLVLEATIKTKKDK